MPLPNYKDGSIVNIMSSVSGAFGNPTPYKPHKALDSEKLKGKNIIFVILDGLGYNSVRRYGKDSFIYRNLRAKATSVFPSDTAACMTSFLSVHSVQQHAVTGWFPARNKYLTKFLAFFPSFNWFLARVRMVWRGTSNGSIMRIKNAKTYIVAPSFFVKPWYNLFSVGNPYVVACDSFSEVVGQVKKIILEDDEKKCVGVYWYEFDDNFHLYGTDCQKARDIFAHVDKELESLSKSISGSNTTIIVTADHGLINTKKEELIRLRDHPQLMHTLEIPPLGDSRVAHFSVKPSRALKFENYIRMYLSRYGTLHKTQDLIRKGYFGLFEPNEELFFSAGNYTLIMKGSYAIEDLIHLNPKHKAAHHGGLSEDEMYVPLAVIEC